MAILAPPSNHVEALLSVKEEFENDYNSMAYNLELDEIELESDTYNITLLVTPKEPYLFSDKTIILPDGQDIAVVKYINAKEDAPDIVNFQVNGKSVTVDEHDKISEIDVTSNTRGEIRISVDDEDVDDLILYAQDES